MISFHFSSRLSVCTCSLTSVPLAWETWDADLYPYLASQARDMDHLDVISNVLGALTTVERTLIFHISRDIIKL